MNQLGRGVYSAKFPAKAGTSNETNTTNSSSSNIQDSTHVAKKEIVPGDGDGTRASKQLAFPSPEVVYPVRPASGPPSRELHVKVWQSEGESDGLPVPEKGTSINGEGTPQIQNERQRHSSQPKNDDAIEDLPTAHLAAQHTSLAPGMPTRSASSSPRGATPVQVPSHLHEVERLETRPMVSQSWPSSRPLSPIAGATVQQHEGIVREMVQPVQRPVLQKPASPLPLSQTENQAVREVQAQRNTPLPAVAVAPRMTRSSRKSRKPLIFMLILLGLVVGGGLGTWIVVYQPFAVPAVTNTDQPFQNSALNISLRYPQGWTAHIDQKDGSVSFYDSSHTGQVNIGASDANGSMNQYIKKEETQLGITGLTNQPSLMFAGASWQQIKGSVVQNGVTYSGVLLATEHNKRFYSIAQLAPPAAYAGEEQLAFSHIRSSLQFLS
jgi:hypothetical protein